MYFESSSFEAEEVGIKQKQWEELSRTALRLGCPAGRHREMCYCVCSRHMLTCSISCATASNEKQNHKQARATAAVHSFSVCKHSTRDALE